MRPDQDKYLLDFEDPYRRCDACMAKYPTLPNSVCDTCEFNTIKTEEDKMKYMLDAIKHPTSFGITEEMIIDAQEKIKRFKDGKY